MHRDLKPQNILVAVDPVTERKQVSAELEAGCVVFCSAGLWHHPTLSNGLLQLKIADFGFARHFIEEGIKQSLHSMAGTPVFMVGSARLTYSISDSEITVCWAAASWVVRISSHYTMRAVGVTGPLVLQWSELCVQVVH